jgi:hypothetical protein
MIAHGFAFTVAAELAVNVPFRDGLGNQHWPGADAMTAPRRSSASAAITVPGALRPAMVNWCPPGAPLLGWCATQS